MTGAGEAIVDGTVSILDRSKAPAMVYMDSSCKYFSTNPVILDSRGGAHIFIKSGLYMIRAYSRDQKLEWIINNIYIDKLNQMVCR
jgi:hypothetical protein